MDDFKKLNKKFNKNSIKPLMTLNKITEITKKSKSKKKNLQKLTSINITNLLSHPTKQEEFLTQNNNQPYKSKSGSLKNLLYINF